MKQHRRGSRDTQPPPGTLRPVGSSVIHCTITMNAFLTRLQNFARKTFLELPLHKNKLIEPNQDKLTNFRQITREGCFNRQEKKQRATANLSNSNERKDLLASPSYDFTPSEVSPGFDRAYSRLVLDVSSSDLTCVVCISDKAPVDTPHGPRLSQSPRSSVYYVSHIFSATYQYTHVPARTLIQSRTKSLLVTLVTAPGERQDWSGSLGRPRDRSS